MCDNWEEALRTYSWRVDLSCFSGATDYPGYFDRVIAPVDVDAFQGQFREAIDGVGSFALAGEVCFWKNHRSPQKHSLTQRLLEHLSSAQNWHRFAASIRTLSNNPSYDTFVALRKSCSQPRGFATPITFLAFYRPTEYPMADKHIANWWGLHRDGYGFGSWPPFSQRKDGWIQTYTTAQNRQDWNAYLAWTEFCCQYAVRVAEQCGFNWRARDVEMAIWEAQKKGISLDVL